MKTIWTVGTNLRLAQDRDGDFWLLNVLHSKPASQLTAEAAHLLIAEIATDRFDAREVAPLAVAA